MSDESQKELEFTKRDSCQKKIIMTGCESDRAEKAKNGNTVIVQNE